MNSTKSSIKHVEIDGQKILFLDQDDWNNARLNPTIDDIPIFSINLIERELSVASQYSEIYVGLGFSSASMTRWTSYTFLKTGDHFQRIFLEKLTCKKCSWRGMTANPLVNDSYIAYGLNPDHFTLMRYADIYPILKCPECDSCLPRHPIWIEY